MIILIKTFSLWAEELNNLGIPALHSLHFAIIRPDGCLSCPYLRQAIVPASFFFFFFLRGSTPLLRDDLYLDSVSFSSRREPCPAFAFLCHPTPVQPGLSHRTLNPVNESRPLFQAFFIPIPATSPRWNATRMPATATWH